MRQLAHTYIMNKVGKNNPPVSGQRGRKKGVPNKATANAREAIGRFVDGNSHRLQEWLEEVYKYHGAVAAVRCFSDLIEYHVPKLARTEVAGDAENPINVVQKVVLEIVDPSA